jgi:hypothetical protein
MNRFTITDEVKQLDINGHVFEVTVGDIEGLAAGEELVERLKDIDLQTLGASGYRTLADEITVTIDQALGAGATATILEGHRPTVTGLIRLLVYVLKEITVDFDSAVSGLLNDLTATVDEG